MEYDPKTATEEEKEEWWRKRYYDVEIKNDPTPSNKIGFDTTATLKNVFDLPNEEETDDNDYSKERENIMKIWNDERDRWTRSSRDEPYTIELMGEEEYNVEHELHKDHYDSESSNRVKQLAEKYVENDLRGYAGKYENLVSSADGVGTKILLAQYARVSYNRPLCSLGQDVVAMVVNDLICQGAEPLFFLDYFASSKIPNDQFHEVLDGIHEACDSINIPLLGGETAKLPGIITDGTFDVAGFGVGKINRIEDELPNNIQVGDIVLGLKSSGFHSNGFTIIRDNISWRDTSRPDFLNSLLEPTKIYAKDIKKLTICNGNSKQVKIKGLAHITGGGFTNIGRILPENTELKYDHAFLYENDYPAHADLFRWVQEGQGLTLEEMYSTFNCGIGMVVIVSKEDYDTLQKPLINANYIQENVVRIGTVMRENRL